MCVQRAAPDTATAAGRLGAGRGAGFLYVEVLVGMLIVSTILLATWPLFVLAMKVDTASDELTIEANFARAKAEELLIRNYKLLANGEDTFIIASRKYRRNWVIQTDTPHLHMKSITVTVRPVRQLDWGNPRIVTLSFYRAQ